MRICKKTSFRRFLLRSFIKNIPYKHITTIPLLIAVILGSFFGVNNSSAAVYGFTQSSWTGGQTSNTATHTSNQSNWTEYSAKDANLTAGTTLTLNNTPQTTDITFDAEGDYIQEDANNTDFAGGQITLHGSGVVATGGTASTFGSYTVRTFTANDTLSVTSPGAIDYLVVGGGGGGGMGDNNAGGGGGGGAGGLVYSTNQQINIGTHDVVIGSGGGSTTSGSNSSFNGAVALGGGNGGFTSAGGSGGSGGGGARGNVGGSGLQPSSTSGGFGYAGGKAYGSAGQRYSAGGGGGAGSVGYAPTSSTIGGTGGAGMDFSTIFGTAVGDGGWFASGGGGGGTGGATRTGVAQPGGGGGGGSTWEGVPGMPNTGGGGSGGDGNSGSARAGGTGGSGVVIIRYSADLTYPTTPYYVTTNATSQKNTSTWGAISSITTTQTTPTNTNIKYLVSFDNRTTWQYWNGSSWQTSTLANITTNGMTKATIEGLTASNWAQSFTPGTFDIAASLSTTSTTVTPELDNIQINYTTPQTQTLTSNIYNTQTAQTKLTSIQWSETLPANTDIKFQIRTSPNGSTWTDWCGPDNSTPGTCSTTTYFTNNTGSETIDDIHSDRTNDQYIQYKAYLSTADGQNTPTLSSVTLNYDTTTYPSVVTHPPTNITHDTVTGNGEIISTGGESVARFIEIGAISGVYTHECTVGAGGIGTYACNISLVPNTAYYIRAKATNSAGTAYGLEESFTTLTAPLQTQQVKMRGIIKMRGEIKTGK